MKKIKSKITLRHACPESPAAPHVELVDGGVFDVTDALAALLVANGNAELVSDDVIEVPAEKKPAPKTISALKGKLGAK